MVLANSTKMAFATLTRALFSVGFVVAVVIGFLKDIMFLKRSRAYVETVKYALSCRKRKT